MPAEAALLGGDAVGVCHVWGSLWLLSASTAAAARSRLPAEAPDQSGRAGVRRGDRGGHGDLRCLSVSGEREWFCCQSHPQTLYLHGFCQLSQLRASSHGCIFREAFILSTSLPAQVSRPCTNGDEDYKGEWRILAPSWDGAWWVRNISTGSPWLIMCLCGESLRRCMDWERRFKKKRVRWRLKAQRLSTTFRHIKALLLLQRRSINKNFSSRVMENLSFQ